MAIQTAPVADHFPAAQHLSISEPISINSHYLLIKRLLDISFILIISIPLCIVMLVIALLIRFTSEGPIFYRQKRIGQHGIEFEMLKFRSMYVHTDDSIHREAIARYMAGQALEDEAGNTLAYKKANDPRITPVGRFIRKTSLDELPQFINVLLGDMTLVGPRPPLPYEVEKYSPYDMQRLSGKPGLTGTWQVYGRSRVTFQTMVQMDIEYLQKQSLLEDLKLIFLTIPVMIFARGGA